jgi:hypothetical protein
MNDADRRIDDALERLAKVEASRDFAARVRARIEDAAAAPSHWPRLALACAAVVVAAAAGIWLLRAPAVAPAPAATTARATPPAVESVPAPAAPPEARPLVAADRRPPARPVRAASRPRGAESDALPADHERALAPLASIDSLAAEPIAPDALVMADQPLAPLTPIAPLDVADDIGGGDR